MVRPYELISEGCRLDSKIEVEDKQSNKININEIFNDNTSVLIFRVSEFHCDACVTQCMQILKDLQYNYNLKDVVILGAFSNMRKLKVICQTNGLDLDMYNIMSDLNIPLEQINSPYFFLLNKEDLRCQSFFVALKENPKMTISNLRVIFQRDILLAN